jgi:hypothetical protein
MTRARASGRTCSGVASARLTVAVETPAFAATSRIVMEPFAARRRLPSVALSKGFDPKLCNIALTAMRMRIDWNVIDYKQIAVCHGGNLNWERTALLPDDGRKNTCD